MKLIIIFVCILISFCLWGCKRPKSDSSTPMSAIEKGESVESGWPKDAEGLVSHLNTWNKDELDVYERPELYQKQRRGRLF